MERGPLTLFGAIVAIGLGPSLWLGAQLGTVNVAPSERPSTVGEKFPESDVDFGGTGAGDSSDRADPATDFSIPVVTTSRPSPSAVVTVSRAARRSVEPSVPASPSTAPSDAPPSSEPPASPSAPVSAEPSEEPEPSEPATGEPSPSLPADDDPGDDPRDGEGEGSLLDSPLLVANP